MLAAKTTLPVIGVPIPTEHLGGLDSLLSIVQMPRGVPVATVAIGNATNAGLLAAAILALSDAGPRRASRRLARPPDPGRPRRSGERLGARAAPSTQGVTAPRIPTSIDHSVERRGDEQPPAVGPAEGAVAGRLGQEDPPELDAVGVEDVDARRRPRSRRSRRRRRGSRPTGRAR